MDVTSPNKNLSDQELLEALERTARELRARLASTPPAAPAEDATPAEREPNRSTGPASEGPFAAPAPADCDDNAPPEKTHGPATLLPSTLLWEPPLANPLQPRMALIPTTLHNEHTKATIDTAIGGELGLLRLEPDDQAWAFQQDFFAVVFSRWANNKESVAVDYRFGFPLTFDWGDWEAKAGYEHTSTHLGDQLVEMTRRTHVGHVRDEAVVGLAYRFWEDFRVYGIWGYPLSATTAVGSDTTRYDWGLEWSTLRATGRRGHPFAAFDMELRADQGYTPNVTGQVGWQWRGTDRGTSLRIAVEGYDGDSMYGQFFREHEHFLGFGVFLDF